MDCLIAVFQTSLGPGSATGKERSEKVKEIGDFPLPSTPLGSLRQSIFLLCFTPFLFGFLPHYGAKSLASSEQLLQVVCWSSETIQESVSEHMISVGSRPSDKGGPKTRGRALRTPPLDPPLMMTIARKVLGWLLLISGCLS